MKSVEINWESVQINFESVKINVESVESVENVDTVKINVTYVGKKNENVESI